ncbi:hypothetical protein [Planctomycetes bacterium K23_9]|uniref:Leucine Rich repeats (2 copies) n=1 Tax=Stieleria marina TaxID=1930275 RepID=A0A517NVT9_9BACT|nr:hypothetical protein K239x_32370 [Planctomycetes bacterium K23_9]
MNADQTATIVPTDSQQRSIGKRRSFFRFLHPAPLDAWVLTTLLLWGIAFVCSLFLHLNDRRTDPLDLSMPLAIGSLAIGLGIGATAISSKTPRVAWILLGFTLAVAILIYVFSGRWLDMQQPQWISMDYGESKLRSRSDYVIAYCQLAAIGAAILLALLLAQFALVKSHSKAIVFTDALSAIASFLNRHRTRLMIAFVAIMLPATVLRNIFDPHMQSASFLTSASLILTAGFGWLVVFYIFVQFASTPRWPRTKRIAIVLVGLIGGIVFVSNFWNTQTESSGFFFAICISPFLFLLAVITGMGLKQRPGNAAEPRRWISIWSWLLVIPVFAFAGWTIYRYDLRICTMALLDDDDFFAKPKWIDFAKRSREFQRATGGSARLVDYYSSALLQVRIRDQRDADCLQKLFRHQPIISAWLIIDNLQPFVDTKPLRTHGGDLTLVGGECTSAQFADIAVKIPTLGVQSVRLPGQNDHQPTSLPKIQTFGNRRIGGLANFLDAYVPAGLNDVVIYSPCNEEDWDAIVRHNQACKFLIYETSEATTKIGLRILEAAQQQSISGIHLQGSNASPERLLRLNLNSDIPTVYLTLGDARSFWDLAFVKHESPISDWIDDPPGSFAEHCQNFHWSYGENKNGKITRLWLPDLDLVRQNSVDLIATETLRLDAKGICGFEAFPETDVSDLAKLVNLKQLYLSRNHFVSDLAFLRSMPQLEHLQMQSQDRAVMATTGLEVCKALKSIRIFCRPDPQTIADLATLPKLKTLEVVDDEHEFADEKAIESLRQQLPSVDVQILSAETYEPDLSSDLKEHLTRVRKEARKRLLKLADELKEREELEEREIP